MIQPLPTYLTYHDQMTAPSTSSHVDEPMPWKLDRGRSFGEMGYLPGLDGLRAVAIIGVLLYHAGIDWMLGATRVDVFFVISGFDHLTDTRGVRPPGALVSPSFTSAAPAGSSPP